MNPRILGWIRLTHPFPSILDGLVSGGVANLAGGEPELSLRVGLAMTLLQLGIGSLNDVVDAPRDSGKPGKPIPGGMVALRAAIGLAAACFAAGVALAFGISVAVGVLAVVVIAIGVAYDLRLKGTAWSWLPFALGIPILPVFGWVAAAGTLAPLFATLLPAAVAAGAGLAIGNALVDVERDRAAGISSIAAVLGPRASARIAAGLFAAVCAAAAGSLGTSGVSPFAVLAAAGIGLIPVLAAIRSDSVGPAIRERMWQVEAVGLAALAVVWLGATLGIQGA